MEQIYNLSKQEREEEILKKLIYFIQCDIDALGSLENDKNEQDI